MYLTWMFVLNIIEQKTGFLEMSEICPILTYVLLEARATYSQKKASSALEKVAAR